jgi:ferredoxin-nitrate reductase
MPDTGLVRAALERAELVVVQDAHHPTETSALAHVVLPAAAWPEKEGTMTNSERRVGLVRRALEPPGEARPDWRIFAGLAHALGFGEQFGWPDEAAVFDEFVRCTAGRLCDMSSLSHERLRREGGIQWPGGSPRLYADRRVATPTGARGSRRRLTTSPPRVTDGEYPLLLTTGRVADQWHTMTRTGKSPALRAAFREPMLELHPDDADAAGVGEGELALVSSRRGELRLRVQLVPGIARGVAFAPFHWGALHSAAGAGEVNTATHVRPTRSRSSPSSRRWRSASSPRPAAPAVQRRYGARRATAPQVAAGSWWSARGWPGWRWSRRRCSDGGRASSRSRCSARKPSPPYNRILVSKLLAQHLRPPATSSCARGPGTRRTAWS